MAGSRNRAASWLVGDSAIVELIRDKDWRETPLGAIDRWPEGLRTTVSLILASSFPINLIWGPGNVQIWNESYAVICGQKHPAELGTDYRACWASAWPAIGDAFDAACRGETAYLLDQPMFLERDGYLEETWLTFSLSPIRGPSGEVAGLFHPVTETTQRMLSARRTQALRDLSSHTAVARTTADAATRAVEILAACGGDLPMVALYLAGEDGRLALTACAGVPRGTPISPPTLDLDEHPSSMAAEAMRSGSPRYVTDVIRQRGAVSAGPYGDSLERLIHIPITLPRAANPSALLVAGISGRLPFDDAYRGHVDLVAAGVAAAMAHAVAYEREHERADALAELDRAKTIFFSNIAHELRTPLTLILGPIEEELQQAGTDDGRERLATALRNARRLLRLVNSLLDFSRIEAGRVQASYVATDLAAYTVDLASLFRTTIERAGLEFVVDCRALPERIFVDRGMWEKIVINLLSNAFKHTFAGCIAVRLEVVGNVAQLSVSDTGVGIAKADLPLVFERFHRLRESRSRTYEGTGIGLALVRELARLHGGDVTVESTEDLGSTFRVTIAADRAQLPAKSISATDDTSSLGDLAASHIDEMLGWLPSDAPLTVSHAGATSTEGGAGRTQHPLVIVADDNADMRAHLTRLLRSTAEILAVADGRAALELALAAPPDLVLTDVMMPRLDGFELLAALRADDRTAAVPVILLSARAGEEAKREGLVAGADDYLVKPFTGQELLARVTGAIALSRQRRETREHLEKRQSAA